MQNLAETIYILHKSCQPYLFCLFLLTLTSYRATERDPSGTSEGGGIGSGGAPIRYEFTGRGINALSPWNDATYTYSILQLYKGSNPLSKLQVASSLNLFNQARNMYYYSNTNCEQMFALKVYFSTLQTLSNNWLYDMKNGTETTLPNWPQSYQSNTQKGEVIYLLWSSNDLCSSIK